MKKNKFEKYKLKKEKKKRLKISIKFQRFRLVLSYFTMLKPGLKEALSITVELVVKLLPKKMPFF